MLDLAPWRERRNLSMAALAKWATGLPTKSSVRLVLLKQGRVALLGQQGAPAVSYECVNPCDRIMKSTLDGGYECSCGVTIEYHEASIRHRLRWTVGGGMLRRVSRVGREASLGTGIDVWVRDSGQGDTQSLGAQSQKRMEELQSVVGPGYAMTKGP